MAKMTQVKYNRENIATIEATTRKLISEGGTPYEVVVGVYNALAHGDVLFDNGFKVDDTDFTVFMAYMSNVIEAAKQFSK